MRVINETETQFLDALARYSFLTVSQFQRLALNASNATVIRRVLHRLAEGAHPLVGVIKFPISARAGRIEHVHYLTKAGAQALAEVLRVDVAELDYREGRAMFHRDFYHRRECVNFHIWLTQALAGTPLEIERFDRYFDKSGANRGGGGERLRAATRVELAEGYLIPDVNFVLRYREDGQRRALFCLEMTHGKDAKRVLEQIDNHRAALRSGVISEKYHLAAGHKVLFLFSDAGLKAAVSRRVGEELPGMEGFRPHFLFGLLEECERDALRCWESLEGYGKVNFITGQP